MANDFEIQSTLHVGIIMDGNGRWAVAGVAAHCGPQSGGRHGEPGRGGSAAAGHPDSDMFAFSADNWRRPAPGGIAHAGAISQKRSRSVRGAGDQVELIGRAMAG
jgi:undecaprenyl diphosphate synthase